MKKLIRFLPNLSYELFSKFFSSHFRKALFSFLIFVGLFFLAQSSVYATTYYVDSDITDNYVGSSTPDYTTYNHTTFATTGGTDSVYKTMADISASSFSPGDSVLLKAGGTWRASSIAYAPNLLAVPSSGVSGNPITFGRYGVGDDPILNGSFLITGLWTLDSGSIYSTPAVGAAGYQVFQNDVRLIKETSKASMVQGSFFSDTTNNKLYVWCTDNSDPTTKTIDYSVVQNPVDINGKSWINVDHITVTKAKSSGFSIRTTGSANINFTNCTSIWNGMRGFDWGGVVHATVKNDVVATNCLAHDNLGEGFWIGFGARNGVVNCTAYNNGYEHTSKGYTEMSLAGSNFTVAADAVDAFMIGSTSYDGYNGTAQGLSIEYVPSEGTRPLRTIVKNNLFSQITSTSGHLGVDAGSQTQWINNIFSSTSASTYSLKLWNDSDLPVIYHNTFTHSVDTTGTMIYANVVTNATFKDNIFFTTGVVIQVSTTGEVGFVSNNNLWYSTLAGSITKWGASWYTYANWKTNTGQDTRSVNSSPLFVNSGGGNYHLTSSSPAIKAGINVGVTTDYDGLLRPYSSAPDMGAYQYQAAPTAPVSLTQYKSDGVTSISSGGYTGETIVILKFSMSSTNASDTLTPSVEIKPLGTVFTNVATNTGSAVGYSGSSVTGVVTVTGLATGVFYHWQANITNAAGDSSWTGMGGSPDFFISFPPSGSTPCSSSAPTSSPTLASAISQGPNLILLSFTQASNPVDHYTLEYGTGSNSYQYGADNIGGKGTTSYLVKSLSPGTTYYFRVRAGNGCATGTWSNEISGKTLGLTLTNNLNIVNSSLEPVMNPGTMENSSISNVQGYLLNVKVKDTKGSPVEGAEVTIHSTPQTKKTGKDGVASFSNVESGNHIVQIAYNNYQGEQSINLTGDVKEFNLNITIQAQNAFLSPRVMIVIGIMAVVVLALTVLLVKARKKV